jgi:hypothetical protein
MRTVSLIWPDGSIVTGGSFAEVEDALRATQWTTYPSRRAFRREMRRRATLWTGRRVSKPIAWQTSKAFIMTLVNSGMCILDESDVPTTDRRSDHE